MTERLKILRLLCRNGMRIIFTSIISISITYFLFSQLTNPNFNDNIIFSDPLHNLSVAVLSVTIISSLGICLGLWKFYTGNKRYKKDLLFYVSIPFKIKRYIFIMISVAIIYSLIFAFLSQIFVYNSTELNFQTESKYPKRRKHEREKWETKIVVVFLDA